MLEITRIEPESGKPGDEFTLWIKGTFDSQAVKVEFLEEGKANPYIVTQGDPHTDPPRTICQPISILNVPNVPDSDNVVKVTFLVGSAAYKYFKVYGNQPPAQAKEQSARNRK